MKYTVVIGLEIHAELLTDSKVYCACPVAFGGEPNSRICPVCAGLPGTLPVLNKNAVTLAVKAGIALGCHINEYSAFDRKNYFYPDLPKAYQITQFEAPICTDGRVNVNGRDIRINRIHIEEDAGKLVHGSDGVTLADYNRCGVPLIEIVTEPDMRSADEAKEFVRQVALRLKYAGVCDCRMERGSLRVDVNISLMPHGSQVLGTRAEIKNLNSFRSVERAIEFEIKRQTDLLERGERVIQETRRFSDSDGATYSLRSKEEAHDYRYFPEPDIPPVIISGEELSKIKVQMGEMPEARLERYTKQYGLPEQSALLIVQDKELSDFYDSTVLVYPEYKAVCNMVTGEFLRGISDRGITAAEAKVTPDSLARLVKMGEDGVVSKNAAKEIVLLMLEDGAEPEEIAKEHGMMMSDNEEELLAVIERVISENPESVADYMGGKEKAFGYLMGQTVRLVGKSVNPHLAKKLLIEQLDRL